MADKILLEHKSLKDSDGKPRTHLATAKEAEVLQRGNRGWRKAAKSKQPEPQASQQSSNA